MLYINSSVTCHKFAPKWPFSYFQPILVAIFVTIATVKVESMPDFYTLAIVLINKYKETCEEQLLFFDLIGGGGGGTQNSLYKHVPLYTLLKIPTCLLLSSNTIQHLGHFKVYLVFSSDFAGRG